MIEETNLRFSNNVRLVWANTRIVDKNNRSYEEKRLIAELCLSGAQDDDMNRFVYFDGDFGFASLVTVFDCDENESRSQEHSLQLEIYIMRKSLLLKYSNIPQFSANDVRWIESKDDANFIYGFNDKRSGELGNLNAEELQFATQSDNLNEHDFENKRVRFQLRRDKKEYNLFLDPEILVENKILGKNLRSQEFNHTQSDVEIYQGFEYQQLNGELLLNCDTEIILKITHAEDYRLEVISKSLEGPFYSELLESFDFSNIDFENPFSFIPFLHHIVNRLECPLNRNVVISETNAIDLFFLSISSFLSNATFLLPVLSFREYLDLITKISILGIARSTQNKKSDYLNIVLNMHRKLVSTQIKSQNVEVLSAIARFHYLLGIVFGFLPDSFDPRKTFTCLRNLEMVVENLPCLKSMNEESFQIILSTIRIIFDSLSEEKEEIRSFLCSSGIHFVYVLTKYILCLSLSPQRSELFSEFNQLQKRFNYIFACFGSHYQQQSPYSFNFLRLPEDNYRKFCYFPQRQAIDDFLVIIFHRTLSSWLSFFHNIVNDERERNMLHMESFNGFCRHFHETAVSPVISLHSEHEPSPDTFTGKGREDFASSETLIDTITKRDLDFDVSHSPAQSGHLLEIRYSCLKHSRKCVSTELDLPAEFIDETHNDQVHETIENTSSTEVYNSSFFSPISSFAISSSFSGEKECDVPFTELQLPPISQLHTNLITHSGSEYSNDHLSKTVNGPKIPSPEFSVTNIVRTIMPEEIPVDVKVPTYQELLSLFLLLPEIEFHLKSSLTKLVEDMPQKYKHIMKRSGKENYASYFPDYKSYDEASKSTIRAISFALCLSYLYERFIHLFDSEDMFLSFFSEKILKSESILHKRPIQDVYNSSTVDNDNATHSDIAVGDGIQNEQQLPLSAAELKRLAFYFSFVKLAILSVPDLGGQTASLIDAVIILERKGQRLSRGGARSHLREYIERITKQIVKEFGAKYKFK